MSVHGISCETSSICHRQVHCRERVGCPVPKPGNRQTRGSGVAYRTNVHKLLGADIISAEEEGLVIVVEQLEELGLVLHGKSG